MELPSYWSSRHISTFSTWAVKLGLRRSYFGMQVRLSIPRGHITNLRRCVAAASRLTSSEDTSQTQTTLNTSSLLLTETSSSLSQSRVSELSELSYLSLRQLCKDYQIKSTGKKQELIDRLVSLEQAVRSGLSVREERSIGSRRASNRVFLPLGIPSASLGSPGSPGSIGRRAVGGVGGVGVRNESMSDEETLLHQLRREEFERNHEGEDYYRDANGRYNLSLDDQSDFSDAPNLNPNLSTWMSPTQSRIQTPHKMVGETPNNAHKMVGETPNNAHKMVNETPYTPHKTTHQSSYTPHKTINEASYTPHKRVAWSSPGRSVLESPHRSLLDSSSFLGDLPRFGSLRYWLR